MSDWQPKRFWKEAKPQACDGGFEVLLDDRSVRTPAKAPLVVPTHALALAIANEWDAQGEKVNPNTMPVTRGANSAIDKLGVQREEVIAMLAEYGDSDLLCYRAAAPVELVKRQADSWDPMLDWAADTYGARLFVGEGVMHVPQTSQALEKLRAEVCAFDNFALAAVHDLISISGSLVLALAVTRAAISPTEAFAISRIDEHWQIEQWGEDEEAAAAEQVKLTAFENAARFYALSRA